MTIPATKNISSIIYKKDDIICTNKMKSPDIYVAEKTGLSFSVLDLPLNPPEPCPSTSAYSGLVAEVTAGLPVSEARHHKLLTYIEYRAVSGVFRTV
jgi:hypothetical protein